MSSLVETVKNEILGALESDQLTLPTLPEVALKVRDIAEDPNAYISDLTTVISQDAALAARIIRVTNSPLLRAPQEVKDITIAVSRLGMNYTANLAIGLAMEQMFQATSDIVDQRLRQSWSSSTEIATIAHVIAQKYSDIPADEATLAALVHRIGILPILTFAEERDDLIHDGISLDKIIDHLHPELGQIILEKWDFAETLSSIPLSYKNYQEKSTNPLVDIIKVANLIYFLNHPGRTSVMEWASVPAFESLGITPDPESDAILDIIKKAKEAASAI